MGFVFIIQTLKGQDTYVPLKKRVFTTKHVTTEDFKLDGNLAESFWNDVEWETSFRTRRPTFGEIPSDSTSFKIVYDDKFIYVGLECHDDQPSTIEKRLSRRDQIDGDFVVVSFDSYHDLQTCFSFLITASGVKGDEIISDDGNGSDQNWNPIWFAKTHVHASGWTAELKIPMSQLRFTNEASQVWGMQIDRQHFKENERSSWQPFPQNAPGWVSTFGELHGLIDLKSRKQIELQPYTLTQLEKKEENPDSPFSDDSDMSINAGLDGKISVTNDLTLDFTVNPDFGQVEADPAALTLDGFQIFFSEQRPFFVESRNLFDFRVSQTAPGNTFGNDNLFYSRRIGKNPSHYPSLEQDEWADIPQNTSILAAAKLSGKTQKGWTIGIMETVTQREHATIRNTESGEERREVVEPLSNYFVARIGKDFNERNSFIGGIITSTNRQTEEHIDYLHNSAQTAAIDFRHQWKDRTWYVSGNFIASHVRGSQNALFNTQRSIGHLFQRADAEHLNVDTTKTSMTGNGGHVKIGKNGGNLMFQSGVTWRSPELELNDVGFMRQTDDIRHFTWAGYRWRQPFSIFNFVGVNYNHWLAYDYAGNRNSTAFNVNAFANFKNNWGAGFGMNITPYHFSNFEMRGGPRFRMLPKNGGWFWFDSDGRKKFQFGANVYIDRTKDQANEVNSLDVWLSYVPSAAIRISMNPFYSQSSNKLQYVTQYNDGQDQQYLLASLDRETFGVSFRFNYTINPNMSLQYYAQPYASKVLYNDYKLLQDATAVDLNDKVLELRNNHLIADESGYFIDANGDGRNEFTFNAPDFTYVQFRSNLVFRWEYIPGSELFVVWSQSTNAVNEPDSGLFRSLNNQVFDETMDNIFLVKMTYRLAM